MKPTVVTGAAGFIGRNVVAELNRRGVHNIILVDTLGADEKWRNLVGLQYEDVLNPQDYLSRVRADRAPDAEAIVHLGACSATTERNADYLLENNYRYTRILCEHALAHRTRFVYASSAATYGDGSLGYDDDSVTRKLRPLNMYEYSKHMLDLWALQRGLFDRVVGLKYFNVFSPFEDHKGDMRSVVHKSFHQIQNTGAVTLFKSHRPDYRDGEQMRDFVYVKDAVDVTLHFVLESGASGLFNCGTGNARTWIDLVRAVFKAAGAEERVSFVDMPEALRAKYQYFTQATTGKLRNAGYVKPFTSLEDAVAEYVRTHLSLCDRTTN